MPKADQQRFFLPSAASARPSNGPPINQSAKNKRLTLPLDDRLAIAELHDLFVGDADSRLERIAIALERIAGRLDAIDKGRASGNDEWRPRPKGEVPF